MTSQETVIKYNRVMEEQEGRKDMKSKKICAMLLAAAMTAMQHQVMS